MASLQAVNNVRVMVSFCLTSYGMLMALIWFTVVVYRKINTCFKFCHVSVLTCSCILRCFARIANCFFLELILGCGDSEEVAFLCQVYDLIVTLTKGTH